MQKHHIYLQPPNSTNMIHTYHYQKIALSKHSFLVWQCDIHTTEHVPPNLPFGVLDIFPSLSAFWRFFWKVFRPWSGFSGATSISDGFVSRQFVLLRLTMLTKMNDEILQTLYVCVRSNMLILRGWIWMNAAIHPNVNHRSPKSIHSRGRGGGRALGFCLVLPETDPSLDWPLGFAHFEKLSQSFAGDVHQPLAI